MTNTTFSKTENHITRSTVKRRIDQELNIFFNQRIDLAYALSEDYGDLWNCIKQTVVSGGKRIRPYLVLVGYTIGGQQSYSDITSAMLSFEVLHQALLIHDDIIDRDYFRHSQPNVIGYYRNKHKRLNKVAKYADSVALLAGDLLISASESIISESNMSDNHKLLTLNNLNKSIFELAAGELLDIQSLLNINQPNPLLIARYKTAGYSFKFPLITGAELAGSSIKTINTLTQYGEYLGIAYQINDDILGSFGNPKVTGKSNVSDIKEAKNTLLMSLLNANLHTHDKDQLKTIMSQNYITNKDVSYIKNLMIKSGSLLQAEAMSSELVNKAINLILESDVEPKPKEALIKLAKEIESRNF